MSEVSKEVKNSPYRRPGKKPKDITIGNDNLPCWIELIHDLMVGAGYSYSRIAYRIKVSPSTIQKLATHMNRHPRSQVFYSLIQLYKKVFQGPYKTAYAEQYFNDKGERGLQLIAEMDEFIRLEI